jgi:hypothetical protein
MTEQSQDSLHATMERQLKVISQIIDALSAHPRDRAMAIILSWFSIDDLEQIAPTLMGSGEPPPTQDEAQAAMLERLRISTQQAGIILNPQWMVQRPIHNQQALIDAFVNALWEAK